MKNSRGEEATMPAEGGYVNPLRCEDCDACIMGELMMQRRMGQLFGTGKLVDLLGGRDEKK